MKVLHLTVHMGAGVGKAISGMTSIESVIKHMIIVLEKPNKMNHIEQCRAAGIEVQIAPDINCLKKIFTECDVIIVNWWHHPLLYQSLMYLSDINARLVLWSHVNGLFYPWINPHFLRIFDLYMFTSRASLNNPFWSDEERTEILSKSKVVYGMGNFQPSAYIPKNSYDVADKIHIGYVGTLDYSKMHPDSVKWMKSAQDHIGNLEFDLVGEYNDIIYTDVQNESLLDCVKFLGFRNDVPEILRSFDIFMYPLNPHNYATTENALLEAMSVGLPIIASGGVVEQSILKSGENAILVNTEDEFVRNLTFMTQDPSLRSKYGIQSRKDVIRTYDCEINHKSYVDALLSVMNVEKTKHDFIKIVGSTPFEWFLNGCNSQQKRLFMECSSTKPPHINQGILSRMRLLDDIYWGPSKGSVFHYYACYPNDKTLEKIVNIMDESRSSIN